MADWVTQLPQDGHCWLATWLGTWFDIIIHLYYIQSSRLKVGTTHKLKNKLDTGKATWHTWEPWRGGWGKSSNRIVMTFCVGTDICDINFGDCRLRHFEIVIVEFRAFALTVVVVCLAGQHWRVSVRCECNLRHIGAQITGRSLHMNVWWSWQVPSYTGWWAKTTDTSSQIQIQILKKLQLHNQEAKNQDATRRKLYNEAMIYSKKRYAMRLIVLTGIVVIIVFVY